MNKELDEKAIYDLGNIHQNFSANSEGLRVFISNLSPVAKEHDKILMEKITKICEELLKIAGVSINELKKPKHKKITFKPTKKQKEQVLETLKVLPHLTASNVELLYKSAFVMLVSYFDFLISDLIHYFYQRYPKSLSGKELSITLNELNLCNHLTEATDYIVNKEVDKILYDSLEGQKGYFKNFLKIDESTLKSQL